MMALALVRVNDAVQGNDPAHLEPSAPLPQGFSTGTSHELAGAPPCSAPALRSWCQGIPVAVHGVNEARLIELGLDLSPQARNGLVYRPGRRGIVRIAPHTPQQFAAMDDPTGARR